MSSQEEKVVTNIVDVPDIPMPTTKERDVIEDTFKGAVRYAIIGAGQGGSRIAETFWNQGYRRVCIVNTSAHDANTIKIPEENKLLIEGGGAGKDITKAEVSAKKSYEDILDFLRKGFKSSYDRILVCIGAGGGTGAGSLRTLIDIAHDLNISLGIEKTVKDKRVGVLIALPTNAEGKKVALNALTTLDTVYDKAIDGTVSPLIILDNQRIKDVYPGLSVNSFWNTANRSVCSLFHLFNTVACQDSSYTTFDVIDYKAILDSGVITFGATPLEKYGEADISFAIRDNLKRNILAGGGIDISKGTIAGCVVIGHKDALSEVTQESLECGFEQLSRILSQDSTVHRGIYQGNKEGLVIYTVIGGLGEPVERIEELERIADRHKSSVYEKSGDK